MTTQPPLAQTPLVAAAASALTPEAALPSTLTHSAHPAGASAAETANREGAAGDRGTGTSQRPTGRTLVPGWLTAHPVAARILYSVLALWAAYTVTFLIVSVLPGDPVSIMLSSADAANATPEQIAALRAEYGLDQPLWLQYVTTLLAAVRLDLGNSYVSGQAVTAQLAEALPTTVSLAAVTLVLAVLGGAALAILAVSVRSSWLHNFLAGLPSLGVSMPTFWVGLILLQVFSFRLGWIPALGGRGLAGVILPALTLALPLGAMIAQVFYRSLMTTSRELFTTTFRAAGLSELTTLITHTVPVAATSLLSVAGLVFGQLLGGAVVVETVFTRNGIGRLAESAVTNQDVPVVQGVVLFCALVFIAVNLITDLLYPLLDPRTKAVKA